MAVHATSTPAPAVQPGLLRDDMEAGFFPETGENPLLRSEEWPELPPEHLLPASTPLPSLTHAFSRRRAIFGAASAVAVTGCAPTPEPYSAPSKVGQVAQPFFGAAKLPASDARLVDLGATLEILAARMDVTMGDDEEWSAPSAGLLVRRVGNLTEELAATPASTLDGLAAKIRALVNVALSWEDLRNSRRLAASIAADVTRMQAEGGCFA